jgi:putative flippase GtrA
MFPKFFRHSLIAGMSFFLEFTIFNFLYYLRGDLLFSQFVSVFISVLFGYCGHTCYTYKLGKFSKTNIFLYFTQASFMFLLNYLLLHFMININDINYSISKIIQMSVAFPINFSFGYFISFRKPR